MANINFPTELWDSKILDSLGAEERYLYIYLFTSPDVNNMGIYATTHKRMMFHTGMKKDELISALNGLSSKKVAYYKFNHIIIPNKIRDGGLNANRRKGVINDLRRLHLPLLEEILKNDFNKFIGSREYDEKIFYAVYSRIVSYTEAEDKKKKPKQEKQLNYLGLIDKFKPWFKSAYHPKSDKQIENWNDTLRLLIEYDKYTIEQIEKAIKWAKNDEFWRDVFRTLPYLRDTNNKTGLKYIELFLEERQGGSQGEKQLSTPSKKTTLNF